MVTLLVKSTKERDTFLLQVPQTQTVREAITLAANLQNARAQLRHQLHSIRELCDPQTFNQTNATVLESIVTRLDGSERIHYEGGDVDTTTLNSLHDQATTHLQAATTLHSNANETEALSESARTLVEELWPRYCTRAVLRDPVVDETEDTDPQSRLRRDAVVAEFYRMHDDPDIDEDLRLRVYHWRAILDRQFRPYDYVEPQACAAWFANQRMDPDHLLNHYTRGNEKSKLTIKLAAPDAEAPQREPRIEYNVQRALRDDMKHRVETFKALEPSELGDRVRQQVRQDIKLPLSAAQNQPPETFSSTRVRQDLCHGQELRPIFPSKVETDTQS